MTAVYILLGTIIIMLGVLIDMIKSQPGFLDKTKIDNARKELHDSTDKLRESVKRNS